MNSIIGLLPQGVMKLVSLAFVVIGFLLLATGYRYGYTGTAIGGVLLVVVGIVLLIGVISGRNRNKSA